MWKTNHLYMEEVTEGGAPEAAPEAAEVEAKEEASQPSSLLQDPEQITNLAESEYFKKEKFKTPEQQLKAYVEAEKRLGGFRGAPEEYKLPDNVSGNDELAKEIVERAKKHNASQEVLDDFLEVVDTYIDQSFQTNQEAERAKLGDNADERLQRVETQLKNKFQGEEFDRIAGLVNNAESVMLIEALLGGSVANLPADEGSSGALTWGDVEAELLKKDDKGRYLASYDIEHKRKVDALKAKFEQQNQKAS